MVIAMLTGGMGNQMFQYACARSCAERRGDKLILCTSRLSQPHSRRRYALGVFSIKAPVSNDALKGFDVIQSIVQIDSRFHPSVLDDPSVNIALQGYWESEKYFVEIKNLIRDDFSFRGNADGVPVSTMLSPIRETESVCVHVRRSDLLLDSDPKGFVGLDYYDRAVRRIKELVCNPTFYVFSDDIAWCRNNLNIDGDHRFVSGAGMSDGGELETMTACKHFIIANSSFSWWGAWLGTFSKKVVIAPRRWFRMEGLWNQYIPQMFFSDDLIPGEWIRV